MNGHIRQLLKPEWRARTTQKNRQKMQKEFLLPKGLKRVGWVLLATALAMGIWSIVLDFDFTKSEILKPLTLVDPLINNYIVIGIWLGAIFVGCSREPIEDEMISRIRLNALLVGLYLQATFIITATFVFNSVDYLEVMMYNLVTYPLIFLAVYRWMLWRALKSYGDGE